jgi:WD40 repeat protein
MVAAVAIAPDQKTFVTVNDAGRTFSVRLWELQKGKQLFVLQDVGGGAIKFSPDGKTVLIGGFRKVMLWDTVAKAQKRSFAGFVGTVCGLDISPDGTKVAACDDETFAIFDLETGKQTLRHSAQGRSFTSVAFSPDGSLVAVASSHAEIINEPGQVAIWKLSTRKLVRTLVGHGGEVTSIAFSRDGSIMAAGGLSRGADGPPKGETSLWSVQNGEFLTSFGGHQAEVRCAVFSPDASILATAGDDDRVLFWNPTKRRLLGQIDLNMKGIRCVAFSADGRLLIAAGDNGTIALLTRDG